jgi:hypothetical protein
MWVEFQFRPKAADIETSTDNEVGGPFPDNNRAGRSKLRNHLYETGGLFRVSHGL